MNDDALTPAELAYRRCAIQTADARIAFHRARRELVAACNARGVTDLALLAAADAVRVGYQALTAAAVAESQAAAALYTSREMDVWMAIWPWAPA